jgi:GNAT superfamily N-acetyltransferase
VRPDRQREVILRPIERADIDGCIDVFYLAVDELYRRLDQPLPPRDRGSLAALIRHLVRHDPARAWLAEEPSATSDPVRPAILGFGAATLRDWAWYLALLFVRPEAQGAAIGRRLLLRCFPGGPGYVPDRPPVDGSTSGPSGPHEHAGEHRDHRDDTLPAALAVCVDSIQPVSTGLYARFGIVPRVPIYTVLGTPARDAFPPLPREIVATRFEALPDAVDLAGTLAAVDRQLLGYARQPDHAFWASEDRHGVLFRTAGAGNAVGYGYTQPRGRLGPVALLDSTLYPAALGALFSNATPPGAWMTLVPGSNDRALVALLRAGMRFDGFPAVFASTREATGLDRYLPAGFALL